MKFFFFFQLFFIVFSIKTEIKFTLNVPSLFRCKKNGPVFYFENFPSDQLFAQTIKNSSKECDLILIPSEKRVIYEIDKHILRCHFRWLRLEKRLTELLYFKSNCTLNDRTDLCVRITPRTSMIITDYSKQPDQPMSMDLRIHGIGTEHIIIGDDNDYPFSYINDGFSKSGARRYEIVFKVKHDEYLNMMCRFTYMNNPHGKSDVCQMPTVIFTKSTQTRSGPATTNGNGWSWLCYYYPSGVEQPLDYKMINKARDDYEKSIAIKSSDSSNRSFVNLTEFSDNNSSMALTESEKGSSSPIVTLLVVIMIASGIFCIYKNKCQVKTKKSNDADDYRRSSFDSQDSGTSNKSTEDDDDDDD